MEIKNSENIHKNQSIDDNNNNSRRESLINTAVKFLQNPRVSSSPLQHKQKFLEGKGLTVDEIKKAFELASIVIPVENQPEFSKRTISGNHINTINSNYPSTLLYKIKEFFNTTALIGTTIYCIHWFYKKFIRPYIFENVGKRSIVDDSHSDALTKSIIEMKEAIVKMEDSVNKLMCNNLADSSISHLVQDLKQDLTSLKGLLLSRKQFPSAPPSIPPWQLETQNQSREKAADREDDAASGSSTNNSDSSLEMIREEPPK